MMETQRRAFTRYLSDCQQTVDCPIEPLRLSLVLADEKPATLFDPSSDMHSQHPRQLFDELNLSYRRIKDHQYLVVASSSHWLDFLPTTTTGADTDAYSRRLGCVFGYPKADVENFIQTSGTLKTLQEFSNREAFSPQEVAYIIFSFYRPEESKEGYERAIAIGKRHYSRLCELANEWKLPELITIADKNYDGFVDFCAGEVQLSEEPANV